MAVFASYSSRAWTTRAHTPFRYAGQGYHLSCVPVERAVVCAHPQYRRLPGAVAGVDSRERSILELLAGGETTASAAVQLGIREATVRSHVENMRSKMGASAGGYRRERFPAGLPEIIFRASAPASGSTRPVISKIAPSNDRCSAWLYSANLSLLKSGARGRPSGANQ